MNTRTNHCNKHLSIVINESYKTLESLTWKLLDQDNKFVRECCKERQSMVSGGASAAIML